MDEYRPQLQQILQSYFTEHDVAAMIFPTTPFTAPEITEDLADLIINGQVVKQGFSQMINNTLHQTVTGIPSMVVPAGLTDDGLPVGLSFDGPMGSDRQLIAIGNAFERARGEFARPVNR
jgi:mandelamide amidase